MSDSLPNSEPSATAQVSSPADGGAAPESSGDGMQWLKENAHKYQDTLEGSIASGMGLGGDGAPTQGDEAGEAAGKEAEGDGGDTAAAPSSPLYEKAVNALKRGLPKGMHGQIDKMSREEVLENGLSLADQQAEQDRFAAEHGRSKQEARDSGEGGKVDSGDVDAAPAEPAKSIELDLSKALEPLDADLYGDELPKALTAAAGKIVEHVQRQADEKIAALQEGFNDYVRSDVGRQLEERFPMLREATNRAEVQKVMREIAPAMEYESGDLLRDRTLKHMERACQIAFGPAIASQGNPRSRAQGQPTPPTRRAASQTKTKSSDERSVDWLRTYKETGGNVAAANRASGF